MNGYENPKLPKGYAPWWEIECHSGSKKRERRAAKRMAASGVDGVSSLFWGPEEEILLYS